MGNIKPGSSEYKSIHWWLCKNYPKSSYCAHCNRTDRNRYEWALKKGFEYARNINHYIELCTHCHRKYDITDSFRKKTSDRMKGNKLTLGYKPSKSTLEKMRNNRCLGKNANAKKVVDTKTGKIYDCMKDAASDFNISLSYLSMMLNPNSKKKNKTTLKYKTN